ncbi:hypothetical protein NQ318_018037 [Aromia moschata]|uniref:Secreted protein n=1 Tax=Aromia moschata TaxID=1265417 RepID=A0AAV8ZCZ5_9CUCU|nr:hypothetical protein NQ318_018037 [Aromia moschata]
MRIFQRLLMLTFQRAYTLTSTAPVTAGVRRMPTQFHLFASDSEFSHSWFFNTPKSLRFSFRGSPSAPQKPTPCRNLNSQDFGGKSKTYRMGLEGP